jgi:hypothetical protein
MCKFTEMKRKLVKGFLFKSLRQVFALLCPLSSSSASSSSVDPCLYVFRRIIHGTAVVGVGVLRVCAVVLRVGAPMPLFGPPTAVISTRC